MSPRARIPLGVRETALSHGGGRGGEPGTKQKAVFSSSVGGHPTPEAGVINLTAVLCTACEKRERGDNNRDLK